MSLHVTAVVILKCALLEKIKTFCRNGISGTGALME